MGGIDAASRREGRCRAWLLAIALAVGWPLACAAAPPPYDPPPGITVVSDINYPPYLFQTEDGRLQGILKDKWELWSTRTGVPVQVLGLEWAAAQDAVISGKHDVIETLSHNAKRAGMYEFSEPYATVEARVYFHRMVSGISNDVATMRGFEIGAKAGSACLDWLVERGVSFDSVRWYPTSEALIKGAGAGEVRLFCMDTPAARYYLFRLGLAEEFRETPPLYTTRFHWAVRKGRPELRDFIQAGYARIGPAELQAIEERWVGNPLRYAIAPRYRYYIALLISGVAGAAAFLLLWNWSLRRRVTGRTAELSAALGTLQAQAAALSESEARLKLSIRASNIGLWDWKLVDDSIYFSPEYKSQLGFGEGELTGRYDEWESRLHPEDKPRVLEKLRASLAGSATDYDNEFRLRHRDGTYRWFYAQGEILRDAAGRPYRMLGCHIDFTERKRTGEALEAERTLFKSLVESLPDDVFSMDGAGRFTMVNPAWLAGSGLRSEDEVLGKTVFDVLPHDIAVRAEAENRHIAATGIGVYDVSLQIGERWVLVTKVPLFDGEGRYAGVIGVRHDVTQLKRTADALARERNLLRSIIDHMPDGISVKDTGYRYVLLNKAALRMVGVATLDEVVGRTIDEFLSPERAQIIAREDREVLETGEPLLERQRHALNVRSGERWLSVSKVPLRDPDGTTSGILTSYRDVTPLKQAADSLASERNLLRSLIDRAPDGIYVKDLDCRFVTVNPEYARWLGAVGVDDVVGRRLSAFMSDGAAAAIDGEDSAVMRSGQALIDFQRRSINNRRSDRWLSLSKVPLRDAQGRVSGLLVISRDITELRSAMEQARQLNVELEKRVQERTVELEDIARELRTFSYSVSHDLRAPLRRVAGFLSMLRRSSAERLTPNEQDMVQRIAASAQRMEQLIDDMLRLSRVAGQEIHIAEVDLSRLASQIATELSGSEPGRAVSVRIAEGMQARADSRLLRIVLENLIGNAWKFTGKSPAPAIEVGTTAGEDGTVYYVKDNGAGFDMQYAQRLFGPFQRLHHADEFPGTGIGLATVARIVRRHGGRIWADAKPEHGATFYFTLGSGPADTGSSRAA